MIRAVSQALVLFAGMLVVGCGDNTRPGLVLAAVRINVIAGDAQTDTVARVLPEAIRVRVRAPNAAGDTVPVPGQLINFVVTRGTGSVFAGAALTNDSGVAQEIWTLGRGAGEQRLEARAVDPVTGAPLVFATATATGTNDQPDTLRLTTTLPALVWVDSVYGMGARVADRFGNPVTDVTPTWTARHGTVSATSYRPTAEGYDTIAVQLGARVDRTTTVSLLLLEAADSITLAWACRDATDFAQFGAVDSMIARWAGPIDSVRYFPNDTVIQAYGLIPGGTRWWHGRGGQTVVYRTNGVQDTIHRQWRFEARQVPDTMVYSSASWWGGPGVRVGNTWTGGQRCPTAFAAADTLRLRIWR